MKKGRKKESTHSSAERSKSGIELRIWVLAELYVFFFWHCFSSPLTWGFPNAATTSSSSYCHKESAQGSPPLCHTHTEA